MNICAVDDCVKSVHCRGWCGAHYWRWRKYGDPMRPLTYDKTGQRRFWKRQGVERFWTKLVKQPGGCWVWTGPKGSSPYGVFAVGGKHRVAHRWAYETFVGPIPDGLELDHLCHEPLCVNPEHLEPVTRRENILRSNSPAAVNARKTHCHKGHEFTPANTYIKPGNGKRVCRRCALDRRRERSHSLRIGPA